MQTHAAGATQWRRFVLSALAVFAIQQVAGLLLFSYPLNSHVVPATIASLVLAWAYTFGPLRFWRSP